MYSMFEKVTQSDENILFEGRVNRFAFILGSIFRNLFFSAFFSCFPAQIYFLINLALTDGEAEFIVWGKAWLLCFIAGMLLFLIVNVLESNNSALCITNERIIIRNGAFSQKYVYYSLKNIGMVAIKSGLFDTKGENGSATLRFSTKEFHIDTNGRSHREVVGIAHLNNAYEAYRILMDLTEGYNETLRVEIN